VFVNEGKIADVFGPGLYELDTRNLPILTTLNSWEYGFKSPFKAEVYFVSTRQFTNLKWGTRHPITMHDPSIGPVRLRAFGTYTFRAGKPDTLITEVVGTDGRFSVGEIAEQLRHIIIARIGDLIGESQIPVYELAANYDELAVALTDRISQEFERYGLDLTSIHIQNISLPPEVEKTLDKRTSMGILGDLDDYVKFESASALSKAAEQEGGSAGDGIGLGMGLAMAQQMASQLQPAPAREAPPAPPTLSYYLAEQGRRHGPYDENTLRAMIAQGRVTRASLIWSAGMSDWAAAGESPATAGLFAQTPPPPPTAPPA